MRKILKTLTETPHRRYLLAFLVLFFLTQLPYITARLLGPVLEKGILAAVQKNSPDTRIGQISWIIPSGLHAENIIIPASTLPALQIDNLKSVFIPKMTRPLVNAVFSMYGGELSCELSPKGYMSPFPLGIDCSGNNLLPERYPLLFSAGVSGMASTSFSGYFSNSLNESIIDFSVLLSNGAVDISRHPFLKMLNLPRADSIEFQVQGMLSDSRINITHGSLISSLGNLSSVEGHIDNISGNNPYISMSGILELNESGNQKIGPWISMMNKQQTVTGAQKIIIEGRMNNPEIRFLASHAAG